MEVAMAIYRPIVAGLGCCCVASVSANAQDKLPIFGVDSLSAEKAPNKTAVGQTKPPSRDASPTSIKAIERPTLRQAADDAITAKICTGCNPDPATTETLPTASLSNGAIEKQDTMLSELRALAPPEKQTDLNTFELASAHREQARSMQEKTDGLWQSWLVSVCAGCGDQKPVRALRYEDWPKRNVPLATGSIEKSAPTKSARPTDDVKVTAHHRGTLEADLSPENVDSIRRGPQR